MKTKVWKWNHPSVIFYCTFRVYGIIIQLKTLSFVLGCHCVLTFRMFGGSGITCLREILDRNSIKQMNERGHINNKISYLRWVCGIGL